MSSLLFCPENSRTTKFPTTIQSASGEHPVISGGVYVTVWEKLVGDVSGLPQAAKRNIWANYIPLK